MADSLPEINPKYSDAKWTVADHTTTVNPNLHNTSVVLWAGDYGYHTGNILWRAHFSASGSETGFALDIQGGTAFAYSIWLDSTYLGSWVGDSLTSEHQGTFNFPAFLKAGSAHVLTILQDHMGYDGDWWAASDSFKQPRGIRSYSFLGKGVLPQVSTWKLTGNLGGESVCVVFC